MSDMKNRACASTQDAAHSEIAGRDAGIHSIASAATQSVADTANADIKASGFVARMFAHTTAPVYICSFPNEKGDPNQPGERHVTTRTASEIDAFCRKWDKPKRGLFFCTGTVPAALVRNKDNITESISLFADIDFRKVADIMGKDDVLRHIRRLKYRPSVIVFSGNGLHCYWIVKEAIDTQANRDRLEDDLRLLADVVAGDLQVAEVSRVLRLPGSHNSKNGAWTKAEIIEFNEHRYELDDLEEWLAEQSPVMLRKVREVGRSVGETDTNFFDDFAEKYGRVDVEDLLRGMIYMGGATYGIHAVQIKVTSSLLSSGYPLNDVVETVLEATRIAAGEYGARWNWNAERREVHRDGTKWIKDHPDVLEKQREYIEANAADGDGSVDQRIGSSEQPAQAKPTVEPMDLWGKFEPPSLPRNLLPDLIERFAFEQGMNMGADMSAIAMSALVVCAAAIPDDVQLKVKRHGDWFEAARLWVALVGPPSAKKTPIMKTVAHPLRIIDARQARANAEARAEYERLTKEVKAKTEPPKQTRSVIQDVTIEAAQDILKDSPQGVLCYRDELSGWFGAMDKYNAGRGSAADRGFWLEAFNGGHYSVHRVGRGSVFIENLSVSLVGGIQPEPLREIANDSVDDGLLQRLLPIMVGPAVSSRDEKISDVVDEYRALIERLDGIFKTPLVFDDGAQSYRQELEAKHLKLQSLESVHRKLAAHFGKYDGIFARLCIVWQCIENEKGFCDIEPVISEKTARRVGAFLHSFLLPHAISFYANVLGLSNDHDAVTAVAGYILAHGLKRITNRDLKRGDRIMKGLGPEEADAVFGQLENLGWLDRMPSPRRGPDHWIVNPVVHEKFAEKAKAEAERRAEVRRIIAEATGGSGEL